MTPLKRNLLIATTCAVFASTSYGNEQYYSKGDYELGIVGSYTTLTGKDSDDKESVDLVYLQGDASYFVQDNVSVGVSAIYLGLPNEDIDIHATGIELNARYHFQKFERVIPYVGLNTGYLTGKVDDYKDDITAYGAHGGLKFPINDNVYFDTQLKYTKYNTSGDVKVDSNQLLIGLKIKF